MFHSLTRCDTTSYYHYRGKAIPWNCVSQCTSALLLVQDLGKDDELPPVLDWMIEWSF